ncbi:MAG: molybdopterin-dependent oxidoreductase [Vampirovibrionales bacterium]|nr:molybdopterin-dependent oxidoreductase [Vampirovibrionales bacterium]
MAFYSITISSTATPAKDAATAPEKTGLFAWPATFYLNEAATARASKQTALAPTLTITAANEATPPLSWTLAQLTHAVPVSHQIRRVVSADGWSYKGHWEGYSLQKLLEALPESHKPSASAQYIRQQNAYGQVEYLPLAAIRACDALLVKSEDGMALSALYGGPLWLMVFDRYSYKGLCALQSLAFTETPKATDKPLSSTMGYPETGLWQPGSRVYAIDLKSYKTLGPAGQECNAF